MFDPPQPECEAHMARKAKSAVKRTQCGAQSTPAPSGVKEPTAAERLAALEQEAVARGVLPVADFDRFLDEVGDVWPKDENLDDFLVWLRQARHEWRY
jgi:hypothetical protein